MYKKKKKNLKGEKITFWKVKKVQKSLSITFEKVIKSLFHFRLPKAKVKGEKCFFFAFLCMVPYGKFFLLPVLNRASNKMKKAQWGFSFTKS
jgi:hypothetical protein